MLKLLRAFAFSSRSLRQRPAYYVVSVALLAFTAAALTIMAALIEALVLRPPTARAPDELVFLNSSAPLGLVSRPAYLAFRERTAVSPSSLLTTRTHEFGSGSAGGPPVVSRRPSAAISSPASACPCSEAAASWTRTTGKPRRTWPSSRRS